MEINPKTKEATFKVPNPMLGYVMVGVRYLSMLGFYGGAVVVCVSICLFESPKGAEHTAPVSPAVSCVMNLTAQFFFVYLMVNIMGTVHELSGGAAPLETYRFFV